MELTHRPRRLRRSESVRSLVRETPCAPMTSFCPYLLPRKQQRQPIESMPGQFRFSVDELVRECADIMRARHSSGKPLWLLCAKRR